MGGEIRRLQNQIRKTTKRLHALEGKLVKMQLEVMGRTEEERIAYLEHELRKMYPNEKFDRELLRLVGTLPNVPGISDKELVRRVVAERYS